MHNLDRHPSVHQEVAVQAKSLHEEHGVKGLGLFLRKTQPYQGNRRLESKPLNQWRDRGHQEKVQVL
jgi:hypothetical protein